MTMSALASRVCHYVLWTSVMLICFGLTTYSSAATSSEHVNSINSDQAQAVVSCALSAKFVRAYALPYINVKAASTIVARYYIGQIIDSSSAGSVINVILYSGDGMTATVLKLVPDGTRLAVVRGGFEMRRDGLRWHVVVGNGGYVDYAIMSKFVTNISKSPGYRVRAIADADACYEAHVDFSK